MSVSSAGRRVSSQLCRMCADSCRRVSRRVRPRAGRASRPCPRRRPASGRAGRAAPASNGAASGRSIAYPRSRTSSCPAAMSTDARRLQRADGVDAARGEVAQRQRERAHDPQPVRDADHRGGALGDEVGARRLEGEDLDRLVRAGPVQRPAVQERAAAALGRPLLAGAEVVDVAEVDVAHRRPVGARDREREERDAALRVEGAVDRVDDDVRRADRRRTAPRRAPRRRARTTRPSRASRATTASSAAASIAVVSSPPSPAPTTRDRSLADGISSSTRRTSSTAARQVARKSVKRVEQEPGGELREEVRRLLRHDLAAARDRRTRPRSASAGAGTRPARRRGRPPRRLPRGAPCT